MGYFGPAGLVILFFFWVVGWLLTLVGVGAIAYVEYARRLFPPPGGSDYNINNLTAIMRGGKYHTSTKEHQ